MRRQLCTKSRKHGLPQLRPITLDANSEEFMGYKRLAIAVLIRATEDLVYEGTNGNEPVKDAIAFLVNPDRLFVWAQCLGLDEEMLAYKFKKALCTMPVCTQSNGAHLLRQCFKIR
jgi:hypothetical protein